MRLWANLIFPQKESFLTAVGKCRLLAPAHGRFAKDHGKTAAQIILRWHLQDGYIAIPGSSNPDHIAENYDIFDFELSEDEMDRIRGIDEQRRYEHW